MSPNRLWAFFEPEPAPVTSVGSSSGFMPCPLPLLNALPAAQHQFVQEIYRIARERAEAQARPARPAMPEFSWN